MAQDTTPSPSSFPAPEPRPEARVLTLPLRLKPLAELATVLERLELMPRQASAEQYRRVVEGLKQLLADTPRDDALDALLVARPALAELYENQHYAQAGLCRSPLERSLNSELATAALLRRVRGQPAAD